MKKQPMKMVLLDLAREKDSLESIFEFFDLVSKYGFDSVNLYLEDRIKTKTYPYRSDAESYSEDDVRKIVAYADKCGLELIPAVSNFGHTERFLEHEQLKHLSECRNNTNGRFHGSPLDLTACPLLPESQEFFDAYFAEVASLFPGKYFMVGLDEDMDIGTCELCKKDVEDHGGIGHLFLNHIKRTNVVLNSLGKIMVMDNDMLDLCPEILPEIPRNVVLNIWCYDYIDPFPRNPFGNQRQANVCKIYEELGFEYYATSWCNFTHNVDSYYNYANKYSPLAHRVTTWQMTAEQRLFVYPLLAFTGKTFMGEYPDDPYERLKASVRETIGATDETDVAILARAVEKPYLYRSPLYFLHDKIVRCNVNFEDEYKEVVLLHELLKTVKVKNDIVDTVIYRVERTKMYYEELRLAQQIIDMRSGNYRHDMNRVVNKLSAMRERICEQNKELYEMWYKYRCGVPTTLLDNEVARVLSDVDKLIDAANKAEFGKEPVLHMHVLLPDNSTCRFVDLKVKYTDGTEKVWPTGTYKRLATSCYNIADKGPYFFIYSIMLDEGKIPASIEIRTHGCGSFFLHYLYVQQAEITYIPTEIIPVGRVEHPEHLLDFDKKFCAIGDDDMLEALRHDALLNEISGVDIILEKEG